MCKFPLLVSANSWVQILSSSVLVTKCVYASTYCAYFCIGNTVLCRGIRGKYHDWSSNTALKYSESCGFLNIPKNRLSGVVRLKLTGLILAILEYLRLAVNGVWQREANKYKLHRGYPISFSSEKPRHFKTRALAFPEGMSPWTLPVCFQENPLHDCAQTLKEICTNLRADVFKDCILTLTVHEEMSLHLIPVMENRNHFFALVSPHLINTYFIDKADWIRKALLLWSENRDHEDLLLCNWFSRMIRTILVFIQTNCRQTAETMVKLRLSTKSSRRRNQRFEIWTSVQFSTHNVRALQKGKTDQRLEWN